MKNGSVLRNAALLAFVAVIACTSVLAGGPLYVFDPATKTPYSWPGGHAAFYTDLGTLGQLTNEQANAMVSFSVAQWNAVPTSSFNGVVAGDFASIGLPDIDGSNIDLVLGTYNGGGVHVVYDSDGSVFTALFGSPYGVLGITIVEFASDTSPDIQEVTVILNGFAVPEPPTPPEEASAMYAGISTHEFGHAINLAHSQTNGAQILFFDLFTGPAGCATPYDGYPAADDIETMYPFTFMSYTGVPESTVDILDDIEAVSDIYPAAGWPNAYGTVSGTVYAPLRANTPQRAQFTGANVVARNVANPWRDATSALSGDLSQGLAGPDGTYVFHGLTPGATYIVFDDVIVAGGFPTPFPSVQPGPEEYWNGSNESGNGVTDDRCASTGIVPVAGTPKIADITLNKVKGAPEFIPIDLPTSTITELSGDGQVGVGIWDGGILRWTPAGGPELIGGDWRSSQAGVSHDGKTITASVADDATGVQTAAIWQRNTGWTSIGALPGSTNCDIYLSSGWGVSDNKTVVGLNWLNCENVTAFSWTSGTGMTDLGFLGDPANLGGSRANRISADSSTVVGWDQHFTGFWQGAQWRNGQETLFHQPPVLCCDFDPAFCTVDTVGSASAVNPNGSIVVGEFLATEQIYTDPDSGEEFHYCNNTSWKWTASGGITGLGDFIPDYTPLAQDVSDDGSVIVGVANPFDFFFPRLSVIWTEETGFIDFQQFLAQQGTYAPGWSLAVAGSISGDGKTVGGFGGSSYGPQGFVVQMPKIVVCHAPPGNPSSKKTTDISFPDSLANHLAHGDTIGQCGNGQ
jgi:probable HAF family extracellular repeat protein